MPPLPCPLRRAPTRVAAFAFALAAFALAAFALAAFALAALAVPSAQAQGIEEKAQICSACHGEAGIPEDKATPIIWGQHQGYLYFQLRDYKRGNRKNEQMSAVTETIERDDMLALAEYFSKKPWPKLEAPRAGEAAARQALQANAAIGCTACHPVEYQGGGTGPRLAGQGQDYLARTMGEFRSKERANNPGMTSLMLAISQDDIAALAQYLAGL
jgi:cytochrome c553